MPARWARGTGWGEGGPCQRDASSSRDKPVMPARGLEAHVHLVRRRGAQSAPPPDVSSPVVSVGSSSWGVASSVAAASSAAVVESLRDPGSESGRSTVSLVSIASASWPSSMMSFEFVASEAAVASAPREATSATVRMMSSSEMGGKSTSRDVSWQTPPISMLP